MLKFATILVGGLSAMGGWAVVTVKDVPEYFFAGQQYTIEFQVRQHGRMLFVAKGCTICHASADASDDNNHLKVGPDLDGRRLTRQYVFQKITNPASQIMPDLGLSDAEATAIAAFLSGERGAATGR